MTSVALLALTDPVLVPAAALQRVLDTGAALRDRSAAAGTYTGWLALMGTVALTASPLLAQALAGTATSYQTAALLSSERLALASVRLSDEIARRRAAAARIEAVTWSRLLRALYADLLLTRREYAPSALIGVDLLTAGVTAPIRIHPWAEPVVSALLLDPLRGASGWDVTAMAATLADWVVVAA